MSWKWDIKDDHAELVKEIQFGRYIDVPIGAMELFPLCSMDEE